MQLSHLPYYKEQYTAMAHHLKDYLKEKQGPFHLDLGTGTYTPHFFPRLINQEIGHLLCTDKRMCHMNQGHRLLMQQIEGADERDVMSSRITNLELQLDVFLDEDIAAILFEAFDSISCYFPSIFSTDLNAKNIPHLNGESIETIINNLIKHTLKPNGIFELRCAVDKEEQHFDPFENTTTSSVRLLTDEEISQHDFSVDTNNRKLMSLCFQKEAA